MSVPVNAMVNRLLTYSACLLECGRCYLESANLQVEFFEMDRSQDRADQENKAKRNRQEEAEKTEIEEELKFMREDTSIAEIHLKNTVHENCDQMNSSSLPICHYHLGAGHKLEVAQRAVQSCCQMVSRLIRQINAMRRTDPLKAIQLEVETKQAQLLFIEQFNRFFEPDDLFRYCQNNENLKDQVDELEEKLNCAFLALEGVKTAEETACLLPTCESILLSMQRILETFLEIRNEVDQKIDEKEQEFMFDAGIKQSADGESLTMDYTIVVTNGEGGMEVDDETKTYPILLRLFGKTGVTHYFNLSSSLAKNELFKPETGVQFQFNGRSINTIEGIEICEFDGWVKKWGISSIQILWNDKGEQLSEIFSIDADIEPSDKNSMIKVFITKEGGLSDHLPNQLSESLENQKHANHLKAGYTHLVHLGTSAGRMDKSTRLQLTVYSNCAKITELINLHWNEGRFGKKDEDAVYFKWPRIKKIRAIDLSINETPKSNLKCSYVKIRDLSNDTEYQFPIAKTLTEKPERISPFLALGKGNTRYQVHIKTGNRDTRGFERKKQIVYVNFCSQQIKGELLILRANAVNPEPFRRDQVDVFKVHNVRQVPEMTELEVWHNGSEGDSWYCDWVKIEDIETKTETKFEVKKVLINKGERKVGKGVLVKANRSALFCDEYLKKLQRMKIEKEGKEYYIVTVRTGDRGNVDFDGKIFIVLHGDKGSSEMLRLSDSKTGGSPFSRLKEDVFVLDRIDAVGKIKKIELMIEDRSRNGWFCQGIDLANCDHEHLLRFPVNRWLGDSKFGKETRMVLEENTKPKFRRTKSATFSKTDSDKENIGKRSGHKKSVKVIKNGTQIKESQNESEPSSQGTTNESKSKKSRKRFFDRKKKGTLNEDEEGVRKGNKEKEKNDLIHKKQKKSLAKDSTSENEIPLQEKFKKGNKVSAKNKSKAKKRKKKIDVIDESQ